MSTVVQLATAASSSGLWPWQRPCSSTLISPIYGHKRW